VCRGRAQRLFIDDHHCNLDLIASCQRLLEKPQHHAIARSTTTLHEFIGLHEMDLDMMNPFQEGYHLQAGKHWHVYSSPAPCSLIEGSHIDI
jgi:hypothetical protein